MEYDTDKIDEVVHALLSLGLHDVDALGGRVWKGFDWEAMNRLHAKGLIDDPQSKAKSVFLTQEQIEGSRRALDKLFGIREPASKLEHRRQAFRRVINWNDLIKAEARRCANDTRARPVAALRRRSDRDPRSASIH